MLATLFRLRAYFLEWGIQRMLDDGTGKKYVTKLFYNQPLIKYLASGAFRGTVKQPSYLSAQNFSKAFLEVLKDAGNEANSTTIEKVKAGLRSGVLQESDTQKFVSSLLDDAQNDLEKFKELLEKWFDDTQERVTSWYKKWIQVITLGVGFIVAIVFNVDTPKIVQRLAQDPEAREQYVAMAQKMVNNPEFAKQVYGDTANVENLQKNLIELRQQALEADAVLSIPDFKLTGWTILGWLITALALSLGAPFWFDLLNKLMKLRSSVQAASSSSSTTSTATTDTQKVKRVG
jgi:hypothetical protein